jgi:hypothetical protein
MSISFPLSINEFWTTFPMLDGSSEMELVGYRQQSMDGAGNAISAKFGQPKWRQEVLVAPMYFETANLFRAMMKVLGQREGAFLAYDRWQPFPAYDPRGQVIGGFTPSVKTVGSDNRSLSIKGLPAHYKLAAGEKISVADGSGKHALMELMEDTEANGSGNTPEFEVQPFLPAWIAVDQGVDISKPLGTFKIVAGSYKPATVEGSRAVNASFTMISVS